MTSTFRRLAPPLLALATLLMIHCQEKTAPAAQETTPSTSAAQQTTPPTTAAALSPDSPMIGTKLGPDGNVAEVKNTFEVSEPIWLTFQVRDPAPGLQIEVMIRDANGEEIKSIFPNAGQAISTVPVRKLEPGRYTAEGLWDDKKHWEVPFEIR